MERDSFASLHIGKHKKPLYSKHGCFELHGCPACELQFAISTMIALPFEILFLVFSYSTEEWKKCVESTQIGYTGKYKPIHVPSIERKFLNQLFQLYMITRGGSKIPGLFVTVNTRHRIEDTKSFYDVYYTISRKKPVEKTVYKKPIAYWRNKHAKKVAKTKQLKVT
jgi:hypothetical protein